MVARQFVERLAKKRGITLPSGDIFAEGAAAKVRSCRRARRPSRLPRPPSRRCRRHAWREDRQAGARGRAAPGRGGGP